ncbi:MAG: tyrosine-type recombinase/integrase [Anaerolineales bacterium]|nr:tyrosine-type recombinase/integrase [Anaerolineales bacterium]
MLRTDNQQTTVIDDYLLTWLEAFYIAKRAQGVTKGTIAFYREKLNIFTLYCEGQAVKRVTQITPQLIREYLIFLESGHNPGGIHACYRVLKTFLFWWEDETEPEGWRNPIRKVKAPRLAVQPIEGVSLETVKALAKGASDRDTAILYALLDTGARAREFLDLNLDDVNQATGEALIRSGKGRKPRYVYLGRTARKALRRYLKGRRDTHPALWVTREGDRLSYFGLREIIRRRAKQAGIQPPALHDFRRGFALAMLRAGENVYTIARLMGHEGIQVLERYLKLTDTDGQEAHRRASPVDNLG